MTIEEDNIHTFEKIHAQIEAFFDEVKELSKKNPNDGINEFKLKFINIIIDEANNFLTEKYIPFKDFKQFDSSSVPSCSDVLMILGQYLNCLEKFRADHIHEMDDYNNNRTYWVWNTKSEGEIRTAPPKKIGKKI